jgi:peptidoglycan/LPS O-acetylase OafA/YrhL
MAGPRRSSPTVGSDRLPAVDGLRAIAVGLVVLLHIGVRTFVNGAIGVDLFFVISGFLITSLLLGEWQRSERIYFPNFYLRRVLRLVPSLAFMLALVALVAVVVSDPAGSEFHPSSSLALGLLTALAFLSDLVIGTGHQVVGPLFHTWSLGVEEQFYLVWPPALFLALRAGVSTRRLLWILVAVAVGFYAASLAFATTGHLAEAEYLPFTRPVGLPLGAALAVIASRLPAPSVAARRRLGVAGAVCGPLLIILGLLAVPIRVMAEGGTVVAAALGTVMLATVVFAPEAQLSRVLAWGPARAVGQRSYEIYLLHFPIFHLLTPARVHSTALAGGLKVVVLVAVTEVVYQLAEVRLGPVKRRLRAAAASNPRPVRPEVTVS